MSIQGPINTSINNPSSSYQCDKDDIILRSASDLTEPSDEDRLDLIAHSLPPFSPSTGSVVEIEMEASSNETTSIFQSTIVQSDSLVADPSWTLIFERAPWERNRDLIKGKRIKVLPRL